MTETRWSKTKRYMKRIFVCSRRGHDFIAEVKDFNPGEAIIGIDADSGRFLMKVAGTATRVTTHHCLRCGL